MKIIAVICIICMLVSKVQSHISAYGRNKMKTRQRQGTDQTENDKECREIVMSINVMLLWRHHREWHTQMKSSKYRGIPVTHVSGRVWHLHIPWIQLVNTVYLRMIQYSHILRKNAQPPAACYQLCLANASLAIEVPWTQNDESWQQSSNRSL